VNCACSSATARIRASRCWSSGGGPAVPRDQTPSFASATPWQRLPRGCRCAGSARSAQRLGLLGGPTGPRRSAAPQPRSPPPRCCEQAATTRSPSRGAGARRDPDRGPGGSRLLGKHLLEPSRPELLEQLCDASVRTRSCRDHAGRTVAVAGPVEENLPRAAWRIDGPVVRRCAGLIDLVHPHSKDAMTDWLCARKQIGGGRNSPTTR